MKPKNEAELNSVYERFIDMGLKSILREDINNIVSSDISGFGTGISETVIGIEAVAELLRLQKQQSDGWKIKVEIDPIHQRINADGTFVLILDEIQFSMKNIDTEHHIHLRLSTCLDYKEDQWKVVHWHGSVPQESKPEDTWHMDEWKRRAEELQQLVDEKTAELNRQKKELEVEAALERIRAASMSMQNSDELSQVLSVMFTQFDRLGIHPVYGCLDLFDLEKNSFTHMITGKKGYRHAVQQTISLDAMDIWKESIDLWKKGKPESIQYLHYPKGDLKQAWRVFSRLYRSLPREARFYQRDFPKGMYSCAGWHKHGYIGFFHNREVTSEEKKIVRRFAREFDLVYRRFLDLQQTESRAREAQIEAALEKIRSASMAMHRTSDLSKVNLQIFRSFQSLDYDPTMLGIILIQSENSLRGVTAMPAGNRLKTFEYNLKRFGHPLLDLWWKSFEDQSEYFEYELKGKDKKRFDRLFFEHTDEFDVVEGDLSEVLHFYGAFTTLKHGLISYWKTTMINKEEQDLLIRLGKVISHAYTRYHDIERAEEQARNAQIEMALERVRSSAMSMHNSEDLGVVANVVFEELNNLEMDILRSGIGILDKETKRADLWATTSTETGVNAVVTGSEQLEGHGLLDGIFKSWLNQQSFQYELKGKDLLEYYEIMSSTTYQLPELEVNKLDHGISHFYHCSMFPAGGLYVFRGEPFEQKHIDLIQRFADTFNIAYTRYEDLITAEAQATEARIEAALEKVRSASLSMEKTDDLQNVVDAVFKEMNKLDIGMDHTAFVTLIDGSRDYNVWVGSADENFTTFSSIPYNDWTQVQRDYNDLIANRPGLLAKKYEGEVKKKYSRYLFSQTGFKENTPEKELRLMRDGDSLITSIAMMEHSGIQIVSYRNKVFTPEDNTILQRFATVFEQAYIRFMDIQTAELQAQKILEERNRLEKTLDELKATQAQLIHSEKMASLGELTAGIAHEIQNPLNFVNNFSEVSGEMIEEAIDELDNGDQKEAIEILTELKENLKKINHHGDRASSIVKGMLAHSRSGSNEKVATDINALCDEYLRLAYHGMRAKDKSFNASYEAHLDFSIPKIKVVPQEIGRVLLNLINNAFQAVSDRNREEAGLVTVTSINNDDAIQILIADNGMGIPDSIKDKIFQPFFTTKPTGEGTGLGLSLSYDIVKAHGGEIKVQSDVGRGSKIAIKLPSI